ncbi:MAG TPA: phosphoenolpyruvate--protein phosphotransferase, partial [Actinomycetota bacterium]
MVGIVVVSHSHRIAEGVAELAREMGGDEVKLETAGGLEAIGDPGSSGMPEHPIGTDAVLVMQAIERAWSDDGVLVLMDLGSAVLSSELALDLLGDERRARILLCEAPLVEGAVAAAVTAKLGMPLATVAAEARAGLASKVAHLGTGSDAAPTPGDSAEGPADAMVTAVIPVLVAHGLHARPAARLVQVAAAYDASIVLANLTTGTGPADATSLNGVATLGVRSGHELEVRASGPDAADAVAALESLAARGFDEPPSASDDSRSQARGDDGSASAARREPAEARSDRDERSVDATLAGSAASPGIAIGRLRRFHATPLQVPEATVSDPDVELDKLDTALHETVDAISGQRSTVAAQAGEEEARIFDAHVLFLRDHALLDPARAAIRDRRSPAAHAWRDAVETVAEAWDALDDEYLRARAADLRSVGAQVLARILGLAMPAPRIDAPGILVAADLTPAETATLDPETCLGIVTAYGGPTSHAAVLARAMGIPAVVGVGSRVLELTEDIHLVVDGIRGEVHVRPTAEAIIRWGSERAARDAEVIRVRARASEPATTIDGTTVEVAANVGGPGEIADAIAAGADGVGLFRTEFLFMQRSSLPDEREQEEAYRAAAEILAGRPLLVRTLDAGADKPIPALAQPSEVNPFLGVRGIRLGLACPDLLLTQLRALLRVASDHPVRVMFPMVTTIDDLTAARALLARARAETGVDAWIEVGAMVEVPAAALTAAVLAPQADFFSIGTNDLTQYTLAADRGNERVAALNDPLHPAVLRLIATTVEAARSHDRWVGVCGELAGNELATPLLLGLGVRELSMAGP